MKRIVIPALAAGLVFLHPPKTVEEAIVEYVVYLDVAAGVCDFIDQRRSGD